MPITIDLKTDCASSINSPQSDSISQMRYARRCTHDFRYTPTPLSRLIGQRSQPPAWGKSRDCWHRHDRKMKKEEGLREGRCTRWWLKTEDSTDLWFEELLLYKIDLVNRREVDQGAFDGVGRGAEP